MSTQEMWEKLMDLMEDLEDEEIAQIYSIYCGKPVVQVDDGMFAVITPPAKKNQQEIKV
jgi:hypothetical protein